MRAFYIWRRISKSDFTFCKSKVITRFLSSHPVPEAWTRPFDPPSPEFDWQYLCDDKNRAAIEENIVNRKGVGDINQVVCRTCFDLIVYQCTLQNLFTLSHVLIMKKMTGNEIHDYTFWFQISLWKTFQNEKDVSFTFCILKIEPNECS